MFDRILVYIACPFSSTNQEIAIQRMECVFNVTSKIMTTFNHIIPFSPVSYTCLFEGHVPEDFDWYTFDLEFLIRCDVLLVLQLDGWSESYGVNLEIEKAIERNIPVLYATHDKVEDTLLDYLQRYLEIGISSEHIKQVK